MPYKLVALRSVSDFDPSKPGTLPSRIKLFSSGKHETAKGQVILNATTERLFGDFQKQMNWLDVPGDFEHCTVPGSASYKGEPAMIAGNFTVDLVAGDGIYANLVNWTPEGRHFVGNGHYRDISPSVVLNDANEIVGLHSFAFCRKGATPDKDLVLFSSNFDPAAEARKPVTERTNTGPQDANELMDALRTLTGSAADASPTQILRDLESHINPTSKPKTTKAMTPDQEKQLTDATTNLTALNAKVDALVAGIDKLTGDKGALTTLTAEIAALKEKDNSSERQAILTLAASEGKVVPVEAVKDLSNVQLKTLCASLPSTVPMSERTPSVVSLSSPGAGDADGLTPQDKTILRNMGVTVEDFKKHGKAA